MPEPLHLFDLPVDILSLILSQLLTAPNNNNNDGSSGVIPLCPCTASSAIINPVPVFLIHPSLYAIAHPLFYGPANTFLLDLTGDHASHIRRFIDDAAEDTMQDDDAHGNKQQQQQAPRQEQLLLRRTGGRFLLLSQEARRRVRKLEMRIDRLRGWLWDDLGPFLQDMAVRGELADFTLLVDESSSSNNKEQQQHRAQSITSAFLREKRRVFDRPPLEGLVRLLADPGIREARLRVRGTRHQRAWCEFHPGRECGGGSLPFLKQHRRKEEEEDVDDEEEVIDVDWRAILSKVDPEGRRRAVAWQV
ncbi:hypothetical protein BBK36DRAFT_1195462 [Trichoderma citrinoviride]|uniref:F-box domain-containing protein n=1 Tax=Trichoderma citrinoviride TaxID=58853 RepID=A0A2T4BG40_9HYPO|nr:hypothetical protein BBK36DRAFT_1195462 [Trichoderma citrinoviride]PTB68285.1 hypothetical protein BBK36DRAFT_1195462 [Trichoderma citrinoviride]